MPDLLLADNFQDFKNLRYGFSNKNWGNCGISDKFDALQQSINRSAVAYKLGVKAENFLICNQVHGTDVVTITEPFTAKSRPTGDAMVTKLKGTALAVLTADCGPILFVDYGAGVIGAAHCGWRGALKGIIANTVAAMEALGANHENIHAALGPCIGPTSYEVGHDFHAAFIAESVKNEQFFRPGKRDDRYMFNLPGYIEMKARSLSLASFTPRPEDTFADEANFYSYRRNTLKKAEKTESLISAIAMVRV